MAKISLENAVDLTELSSIVDSKPYAETWCSDKIEQTYNFNPSQRHSEAFIALTGDQNKEMHQGENSISPGFLQTSLAILLIKKAMRTENINPQDYSFSLDTVETPMFIKNNKEYDFVVGFDLNQSEGEFIAHAAVLNKMGETLYTLERRLYSKKPEEEIPLDNSHGVCSARFFLGDNNDSLTFGNLLGEDSPQNNLHALSCSSALPYLAGAEGAIPHLNGKMKGMYYSQKMITDTSKSPDLKKKGLILELYLSPEDKAQFGRKTRKGDVINMRILAKDHDERFLYLTQSPLMFKKFSLERLERALNKYVNK